MVRQNYHRDYLELTALVVLLVGEGRVCMGGDWTPCGEEAMDGWG